MKASVQWLRELVPGLTASAKEIAARFTAAGFEVEATHEYGQGAEACLVVAVVSMRPHPSKSGLNLVTVDRGAAGAPLELVCGAPNVPPPGGLVVLAPLGAHLPAKRMTIERRAIAGVTSEGMLCSESELGLTEEGGGILVLPPSTGKPGDRFVDVVPAVRDTVLEIGLGANRPDGLGHLGLARELATLYRLPFHPHRAHDPKSIASDTSIETLAQVVIEDGERCHRFGARAILGVAIGPSPLWLRYRLSALGVRSISNVVDVTNIVMLEYGHPMHAFDLDRLKGGRVVVRRAREGETMTTLDGVARTLVADDLVVSEGDGATPVGLAGVMGAANSEIGDGTQRVLFECAYFDARGVRRASRRHGLHTEASHRFERGVDPGDIEDVLARAVALTAELAGGRAVPGSILAVAKPIEKHVVTLREERMKNLLGIDVPWNVATNVLERLGCKNVGPVEGGVRFEIPSHRPDISREVDLIEEVGRVHGFDHIPGVLPAIRPTREGATRDALYARARATAVSLGLAEAVTYAFLDAATLEKIGAPAPAVRVMNPLNENQEVMRTSLLPGLLRAADLASRRGEKDTRFFTLGARFLAGQPGSKLPEERASFAAVMTGERSAWLAKPTPVDVWDAKGIAESVASRLAGQPAVLRTYAEGERPMHLHPRAAGEVSVLGRVVGRFGLLHPDVRDALGLDVSGAIVVVEIDLETLEALGTARVQYKAIPRVPANTRDLAVVVSEAIPAGDVEAAVRAAAGDLAEDVHLFDRFTGGAIPAEHASLAFRVVYRREGKTLTDAEVDAQHAKVVTDVTGRFGATLRA
jgi:phenylalanyl-tRNA synthetase beta chain